MRVEPRGSGRFRVRPRRRWVWRSNAMPPSLVTSPPVKPALTARFFYGWKMEEFRVANGVCRSGWLCIHSTQ